MEPDLNNSPQKPETKNPEGYENWPQDDKEAFVKLKEKLKGVGIEIKIVEAQMGLAMYDEAEKTLRIRQDADAEFVSDYVENTIFKEQESIDQLPDPGELEDIHIDDDEEDEEEITPPDPLLPQEGETEAEIVPEANPATPEKIEEALGKNGEAIKIGDTVEWDNANGKGMGRLTSFEITSGAHIKASVDMGVDGVVEIFADELSPVKNEPEPMPIALEENEIKKDKNILAQEIRERLKAEAGENLTPEQEAELQSKINDKIFEELVVKDHSAYLEALRNKRKETWGGKAIEGAKNLLSTKAVQWYLGLSRKERMLVSFGVGSIAGLAFGATVAPGAIGMASYLTWRAARVGLSGTAGMKAGEWANKKWSAEELETAKTKEIADLKNSDLPLEEKTTGFEDIQKRYKKEKIKMTLKKMGTTIAAGAGTGLLTGLAEHAVMGAGGATKSALESKGGKAGGIMENKLPPRKGIEFVPIKPSTPEYIEPEIEIKPTPVTDIPPPPKNLDSVTISEIPPPESVGRKIFDNPENIMHIKVEGKVNSFWETVKKGLSEDKQYRELTEAQKQNATSFFTNKGIKSPEKFGLTPDENFGVRVESGKEVDLSKLFGDPEELKRVLNGAAKKTLDEQQEIIRRSAKITTYLHEHPNVKLTNDKVADILATKPQTVPETLKMSEVPAPEPEALAPLAKPLINMPEGETVMAGGLGIAGMAGMSILEKEKREQIHEDIEAAKLRLGVLEGGKNSKNPNLERSLSGDSQFARDKNEIENTIRETFRKAINYIYGKKGFMGIGRVEGLNTKKWAEIDGYSAKELVQYTEGELERAKLSPKFIKVMESPENQQFIAEMTHLIEETGGVVTPREREHPGEFMMRLSKFATNKQQQLQNLAKAA